MGLTSAQPATDLLSNGEGSWAAFVGIGGLLVASCPTTLVSESLPTLAIDGDAQIPVQVVSSRLAKRLREGGVATWESLASLSPAALSELLRIYEKTLIGLLALCTQRAISMAATASVADNASDAIPDDRTPGEPNADVEVSRQIALLARWVQAVSTAEHVGEVLTLSLDQPLPDDVAEAYAAVEALPLSDLTRRDGNAGFVSGFRSVIAHCGDERDLTVLRERLSFTPLTLEELSRTFGLSRERVRQLQVVAERRLTEAAAGRDWAEVRWRAQRLRHRLGASIRLQSQEAQAAIAEQLAGLPPGEHDFTTSILLWLAGPYRLNGQTGWIHTGPATAAGPPADMNFLEGVSDQGRIDAEQLRGILSELGLVPAAQDDWLHRERRIRDLNGALLLWTGTVADKAATALEAIGQPASAEEINAIIGEGHNLRAVRGRLLGDDRFVRTDRLRIGLRQWGLEEYSSIVDEIAEEIERTGGEADATTLIATVAQRFNLRVASVESYAGVPRFVISEGRIRLRRPDEPYLPSRTIFDETGCYVLNDSTCVIRLNIDRDTLRGSGRPLPQGLGVWLGVFPGSRREFHLADGETLLVSWPDSALLGPSLGTIRRPILALGGTEGDQIRLTFDRTTDRADTALVKQDDLAASTGPNRLTLLTGIQPRTSGGFSEILATAVGVTPARLRSKLRERGEPEILELLPRVDDPELEAALDQLKAVL